MLTASATSHHAPCVAAERKPTAQVRRVTAQLPKASFLGCPLSCSTSSAPSCSDRTRLQCAAMVASMPTPPKGEGNRTFLPGQVQVDEDASRIMAVHSKEEFEQMLDNNPHKLVVLMCKARGCRPCKAFARKYERIADQYTDSLFVEITGDESAETRKWMIEMKVKVTPTFRLYRDNTVRKQLTGINELNLKKAIVSQLEQSEAGWDLQLLAEAESA